MATMERLAHGYTNRTVGDTRTVRKSYDGPDARARLEREHAALLAVRDVVPVPPVLAATDGTLTMAFIEGTHGQELIEAGHAERVLRACGEVLGRIHALGVVHGDFGPNNVLIDPSTWQPTAVLDWEFAGTGEPVLDLAWCEWVVRMHHPADIGALPAFFTSYDGPVPAWPVRQAAMVDRCRWLRDFCEQWQSPGGVAQWEERTEITAAWTE
jgi:aminoglycoside phosphotransferase (APT) family kinase protein